jgi:hypothetical protein
MQRGRCPPQCQRQGACFYPNDNHITDNDNLGRAFVTWRFWPLAEP